MNANATTQPPILKRRALELRVGRRLSKSGRIIARFATHSSIPFHPVGQYLLVATTEGKVEAYVDLEPLARELGCIKPGEVVEVGTHETMSHPKGYVFE